MTFWGMSPKTGGRAEALKKKKTCDLRLGPRKCRRVVRKCPWRVSNLHGDDSAQSGAVFFFLFFFLFPRVRRCVIQCEAVGEKHLGFSGWDEPALTADSDLGKQEGGKDHNNCPTFCL